MTERGSETDRRVEVAASCGSYGETRSIVDRLCEERFPAGQLSVMGQDPNVDGVI